MKTILVPTDFSSGAESALTYAAELNKVFKGEIIIYHSYLIPVPATDLPVTTFTDEEIEKDVLQSLSKLKEKYQRDYPGMSFKIKTSQGFSHEEIISEEKKNKCDLVVMGTRGASGLREFLIGSNTAAVVAKSVCPVLAVPENAQMKGLPTIVFAANYGSDDFKNVFDVIDLARLFGSEVILLHVATGDKSAAFDYNQLESFATQIKDESKYPNISFKLFTDEDVYDGLNLYLDAINADMLAISMHNRTLAQKMFSRSLTKKMVNHSHVPVLAFHTYV